MDREISDIYVTNNYNLFSLLETNRLISKNKRLENSILEKGILRPIAVNSMMQIIDGQHRFSIAKKWGLEIPYYVTMNKAMNDIIHINNTANKWVLHDYINKYAKDNNPEYLKLQEIMNRNPNISHGDLISTAMGSWTKKSKLINTTKLGNFKFYNYPEFLIVLSEYEEFIKTTSIKDVGGVFQAYYAMASIKKYDAEWLTRKVNELEVNRKILGVRKTNTILRAFLEAYNHNLQLESKRDRAIKWELDLKHNAIVLEDLNQLRINLDRMNN